MATTATIPSNGTGSQNQTAKLRGKPTLTRQCCRPHGQTTIRHDKHAAHREECELPSISLFRILMPLNSPYLASQLNREKFGHRDPR